MARVGLISGVGDDNDDVGDGAADVAALGDWGGDIASRPLGGAPCGHVDGVVRVSIAISFALLTVGLTATPAVALGPPTVTTLSSLSGSN
jgi:hypothetical protein